MSSPIPSLETLESYFNELKGYSQEEWKSKIFNESPDSLKGSTINLYAMLIDQTKHVKYLSQKNYELEKELRNASYGRPSPYQI